MAESLTDFLTQWGGNSALDSTFLKNYGLDNPNAWSKSFNPEGGGSFESQDTLEKLNALRDYQVTPTSEISGRRNYTVTSPNGETQNTSLGLAQDSAFDKFMYSGAPIAMLAGGPLAAALGPTTAGALLGAGTGAMHDGGNLNLNDIFKGAAIGGIGGSLSQLGLPSAISKPISNLIGNAIGGSETKASPVVGGNMASDSGSVADTGGIGNIIDTLTGFFPSGNNLMSALPGLMGMFANYQGQQQTGDMLEGLSGMYGQDSPYAQTMRSNLERRDAAAGRRSQYGAREVELQSKLADVTSKRIADMQGLNRDQLLMRNLMMQQGMSGLNSLFGRQASGNPMSQSGNSLGTMLSGLFKGTGTGNTNDLSSLFPALTQSWEDSIKNVPNDNFFKVPGMFGNSQVAPGTGYQLPNTDLSGMTNLFGTTPSWPDVAPEDGYNFDFSGWGD